MAKSLNRAQLIGNLGADPEIRSTPSGVSVAKLRIATTESYKDKSDQWVETTDWHNVVLWGTYAKLAENLHKGSKVYIEGKIQTRSYDGKDGVKRYVTEVNANTCMPITVAQHRAYGESSDHNYSDAPSDYSAADQGFNAQVSVADEDVPF